MSIDKTGYYHTGPSGPLTKAQFAAWACLGSEAFAERLRALAERHGCGPEQGGAKAAGGSAPGASR